MGTSGRLESFSNSTYNTKKIPTTPVVTSQQRSPLQGFMHRRSKINPLSRTPRLSEPTSQSQDKAPFLFREETSFHAATSANLDGMFLIFSGHARGKEYRSRRKAIESGADVL